MTNETPETPEAKKAREKAEAAAKKAAEAAQKEADRLAKVREDKLKKKVDLAATKRDLEEKIKAINDSQSGTTKQFTGRQLGNLKDLEGRVARIKEQIATIDKELGS